MERQVLLLDVDISEEMIMNNQKPSVHKIFTGIYFVLAVVTLIPTPTASKLSLLGYKALCSFTPISTLGLLALGGLHIFLQYRGASADKVQVRNLKTE